MRTVERIRTLEEFEALQPAWSCLLQGGGFHTIFQTFPWLCTWWRCLGGDHELFVLVVKDKDAIVGVAPLMRSAGREISFIGTPNADYSDIIGSDKPALWADILAYLETCRPDWAHVRLDQITERTPSYLALRAALRKSRLMYRRTMADLCLGYQYDGDEASRSAFEFDKSRSLKKALRRFEQQERYEFNRLDIAEAQRQLPAFFHLHIARWDETATPSKFNDRNHQRFYTELVRQLAPFGHLHLTAMSAAGIPVAYCFTFVYEGTIFLNTIAHNPYFTRWSPGVVFILKLTEHLVREGYYLDFSRGAQEYKQVLTNRQYRNYRFDLFSSRRLIRWHDLRNRLRWNPDIRRVWDHPVVSRVRSRIYYLKKHHRKGILAILCRRAWQLVYQHYAVRVFTHVGVPTEVPMPEIPVDIREMTRDELPALATLYGIADGSRKYRTLQYRFDHGAECYGVFHNGHLVSVGWGLPYPDRDPLTGFVLTPDQNDRIVSDLRTAVPYRGLGLLPYLLHYQLSRYQCRGQRAVMAVMRDNSSMLNVVKKFNFVLERTTHVIKILSIHIR